MLMANQTLLQKHAKSFVHAINLNETGYIGLFFLTEKIYEKIFHKNKLEKKRFLGPLDFLGLKYLFLDQLRNAFAQLTDVSVDDVIIKNRENRVCSQTVSILE